MGIESLKNKSIVLTGASGNLGRELAVRLAKAGACLSLAGMNNQNLIEISAKCRGLGARVMNVQTDLTKEEQCRKLIEETLKQHNGIDVLINCAAYIEKKYFEELSDLKSLKKTLEVNYLGPVYCTKYALPYLKKNRGQIVTIVSILGKISTPGNTAYCGSKFALVGFFDALRLELKNSGVDVTLIYPGYLAERMKGQEAKKTNPVLNYISSILMVKTQRCAKLILNAIVSRKRQVIIPSHWKIFIWINFLFPNLIGNMLGLLSKEKHQP